MKYSRTSTPAPACPLLTAFMPDTILDNPKEVLEQPKAQSPSIFGEAYDCISKAIKPATDCLSSVSDQIMLQNLEQSHFRYFQDNANPQTGLTLDRSRADSPASIAATGFSLTAFPIGVERGWISRQDAGSECLKVLKTLSNAPQGEDPETTSGKHGFFYHFLDPADCTRHGKSEISTIDTALLMSGVLFARAYYDGDSDQEKEIRELATNLYERVDWPKALNKDGKVSHGWVPETGMIPHEWSGYDEGNLLMLVGMGSPTHPLPADSWDKYFASAKRANVYGQDHVTFGPLFGHQYTQSWVDMRGINNDDTRELGMDLFENSRKACLAQNYYAKDNPMGWKGYSALDWGLTACDGPGWQLKEVDGKERQFMGYSARGYPEDVDDGTIAPTAAASSINFVPELAMPTLRHWVADRPEILGKHGFYDAYNMTFDQSKRSGWVAPDTIGIDQGAILLNLENYRSQFVWKTMKGSNEIRSALTKSGFSGGWLDSGTEAEQDH